MPVEAHTPIVGTAGGDFLHVVDALRAPSSILIKNSVSPWLRFDPVTFDIVPGRVKYRHRSPLGHPTLASDEELFSYVKPIRIYLFGYADAHLLPFNSTWVYLANTTSIII